MNAPCFFPALLPGELIIDSFAGGGGASLGIERALGRGPDVAINHDREALAMHAANHPATLHLPHNVWKVDPLLVTKGAPVGLLWASPDCKHHSKAKGGKPVKRNIRDLAWVVARWAKQVRPRIIILENVEEFQFWGPLDETGRPCKERKGQTFQEFVKELKRQGYRVEHRELRACDYGAPTIRKRLFVIARRDGAPIVWPEPTHGAPSNPLVAAGHLKPWRTAAETIDWTLPCHSIFLSREDGRAVGVNRPLADNTMARIAKGVKRYVIDAAKPFIVPITHTSDQRVHSIDDPARTITTAKGGEHTLVTPFVAAYYGPGAGGDDRTAPAEEPLRTQTTEKRHAVVTPFITKFREGAVGQPLEQPLVTVTANSFEKRPGGAAPLGVIAPTLVNVANGQTTGRAPNTWDIEDPVRTVTCASSFAVAAPYLVPRYGERAGQEPRTRPVDEPAPVIVPTANGGSLAAVLCVKNNHGDKPMYGADEPAHTIVAGGTHHMAVAAHLSTLRNSDMPFTGADEPSHTITAGGAHQTVVAAFMAQHNGDRAPKPGRSVEDPISTITAAGSNQALCTAFLAQNNYLEPGHDAREPVSTIVSKGCTQAVVSAGMLHMKGTERRGRAIDEPVATVCAEGTHAAEVRAFLTKYYGPNVGQAPAEPLHTATTKGRFGLVTVTINGEPYAVVDIGMRMLTPRELFRAQGFGDRYIIDVGRDIETGLPVPLTKTAQVRMCGNSVCPDVAEALVRANVASVVVASRVRRRADAPIPLFQAAE